MKSIADIIKDEFIKQNPDLERQHIQSVRISHQGNIIVDYLFDNSDWDNSFNKSREFNLGKASEVGVEPEVSLPSRTLQVCDKCKTECICKFCKYNLEDDPESLSSQCYLTIDEITGVGDMYSSEYGCNQFEARSN